MKRIERFQILVLVFCTVFAQQRLFAQKDSTDANIHIDSLTKNLDTTSEIKILKSAINADTLIPFVANKLEKFGGKIHSSNRLLHDMLDIKGLEGLAGMMSKGLDMTQKRMNQKGGSMNLQSINTSIIILEESQEATQEKLDALNDLYNNLTKNNVDIKNIIKDPIFKLNGIPDTSLVSQLADLSVESKKLDSTEMINIARINYMRSRLSTLTLRFKDIISDLHFMEGSRYKTLWKQDEPSLFKVNSKTYGTDHALSYNIGKAFSTTEKVIKIYMMGKANILTLGIALALAIGWLTYSSKRKIRQSPEKLTPIIFLSRNVWMCALFVTLCCFPFFFKNPPMSLLNTLEIIRTLILYYLLFPRLHKGGKIIWTIVTVVMLCLCIDSQQLESTMGERWIMAFLQVVLIGLSLFITATLSKLTRIFEKTALAKIILFITFLLAVLGLLSNLLGRFSLSKILTYTAGQILMLSMTYKVFSKLALELIYLYTEANTSSRLSAFINYSTLRSKYFRWLFVICGIAFVLDISHGLFLYSLILLIGNFILNHHHKIGEFDFTFYSVFIFFVVIWLSGLISRFVRFALGSEDYNADGKKKKWSSMTLLIRLAIWTLGFLIAIAAAGIPLDKITVVLSALSVGIGFGLQNIANNLVSGVILAFERPIQVGDSIDIGSTSGTVSEIGVRSSKLKVTGGADVIIPNGSLLSEKITNWTLTNRSKQESFPVRVAYGEDLYKVKRMVEEVLSHSDLILHTPAFAVAVSDFGSNTILMKVLFWVRDVDNSLGIRSKLMYEVYDSLLKEGIKMPQDNGSSDN